MWSPCPLHHRALPLGEDARSLTVFTPMMSLGECWAVGKPQDTAQGKEMVDEEDGLGGRDLVGREQSGLGSPGVI